jgi:hypothetical protein
VNRVVIVLEGGLVQNVYSDDERVQVAILDYDVFEDQYPKLDLDNFFYPKLDSELTALKEWQQRKADFLAVHSETDKE